MYVWNMISHIHEEHRQMDWNFHGSECSDYGLLGRDLEQRSIAALIYIVIWFILLSASFLTASTHRLHVYMLSITQYSAVILIAASSHYFWSILATKKLNEPVHKDADIDHIVVLSQTLGVYEMPMQF
jgi:hypothetical protein